MASYSYVAASIIGFVFLAIASQQIGKYFTRWRLPLISGFLGAGMLVGPYGLDFIHVEALETLRFVDHLSLAFIAMAAGNELHLEELRSRLKSIAWVTIGLVLVTFTAGSVAVYALSDMLPFMAHMSPSAKLAVALLAGSILVARSPSSAIAIVKEMRAKGPFTQTVLGVTVIMDVVVITLFGFGSSIADTLIAGVAVKLGFVLSLVAELVLSLGLGVALSWLIHFTLGRRFATHIKTLLVVLAGYGTFVLCDQTAIFSQTVLGIHLAPKPLLACVVAGFWITNFSKHRPEFAEIIHEAGPPIYLAFFTMAGASLALDVVLDVWHIAAALFGVRFGALFLGSFLGGVAAKDSPRRSRIYGLAFVTQAGVGLGLAKNVAFAFPEWGPEFASVIIAIIVANQLVGPPMFKAAITLANEAHTRAHPGPAGLRSAVIFGLEGRSMALALQLSNHGWNVVIAERREEPREAVPDYGVEIVHVDNYDLPTLKRLGLEKAEAIVTMLSDAENLHICELAYEHFGTRSMVVRMNARDTIPAFQELGALVVDPATALVSLLDHMVRSPLAASVIMGTEEGQDIIEIEVTDPALEGKLLRELRLPLDTLVLSVSRDGHMLVSHGFTKLNIGDHVTVIGSESSLEEVAVLLQV